MNLGEVKVRFPAPGTRSIPDNATAAVSKNWKAYGDSEGGMRETGMSSTNAGTVKTGHPLSKGFRLNLGGNTSTSSNQGGGRSKFKKGSSIARIDHRNDIGGSIAGLPINSIT